MKTEHFHDEAIGRLLREAAETYRPSVETKEAARRRLMTQLDYHVESSIVENPEQTSARASLKKRQFLRAGLGASLAVLVGLTLLIFLSQQPSAAKALADVARVSDEYRGWITVTVTEDSGETNISYRNEAKKIRAMVWREGKGFRAEYASLALAKRFTYDSQLQELHVRAAGPEYFVGSTKGPLERYTPRAYIEYMKFEAAGVEIRIQKRQEGDSLRFDVSVPPEKVSERALRELTIWADPQTKLVQRLRARRGKDTADMTVSYADPGIQSIYDLGVPRDAKITEGRREENLEELMDQLDVRESKRFGDGVTLVTERTDFPGGVTASGGSLWVSLAEGQAFYFSRYEAGPNKHYSLQDGRKGVQPEYMTTGMLDGWPRPSWQAAKEALRVTAPTWYFVSDGKEMFQGKFNIEGLHTDDGPVTERTVRFNRTSAKFLGEDVWPCRENMWLTKKYTASTRARLLTHPNRQLVGVRVLLSLVGRGLREHVWWFHREHDYVPVERWSEIDFVSADGSRRTRRHEVRYVDFEKLPDGSWYPSRWEKPRRDSDGRLLSTAVYEMRVFPNMKLDKDWFLPPEVLVQRFRGRQGASRKQAER